MYRITQYSAENFMGLRFVQFKPEGRMIIFTGKNGQGKTSALAGLPYVFGGGKHAPEMPTRRGAIKHKVELGVEGDRGAFVVTRTQSGLKLEMAKGCKTWDTPQAMLDSIYHELTLDPLEFIRLGKDTEGRRKQVEILKSAITLDVDLEELAWLNKKDFEKRREVNREIERFKSEIAAIPVQPNLPEKPVDVAEIQGRIRQAQEHNSGVLGVIQARQDLSQDLAAAELAERRNTELIETTRQKIETYTAGLAAMHSVLPAAAEIRDTLQALREKAEGLPDLGGLATRIIEALGDGRVRVLSYIPAAGAHQTQMNVDLDQARKTLQAAEKQQGALAAVVADARQAFEQAPQPAMINIAELSEELNHAQMVNREIERRDRAAGLQKQLDEKQEESRGLTRAMDQREEQKRQAVANAKMPIAGLTFNNEEILFESVPISQLGEAQQIKISISIALARKPELRLVRIPHGEALDDESIQTLAEMAEEMDFYVWMAKVDASGTVGIFLEDGEIKAINKPPKGKGDLPSEP